jgi:hypothetical protein
MKDRDIATARGQDLHGIVRMPIDLLAELEPHAHRRGLSPSKLVVLIIEAALADNMIDAILDDAGDE